MTDTPPPASADPANAPDPMALARVLMDVAARIQPLLQDMMMQTPWRGDMLPPDRLQLGPAYAAFLGRLWSDPERFFSLQMKFWQDWGRLWQASAGTATGGELPALYVPDKGDRRFRGDAWTENPAFDFIKQSYLLAASWLREATSETDGLDAATRAKVDFFNRQLINAMAPSNFLLTNPEVLRTTMESGGENLVKGFQNLAADLRRGHGALKISTVDQAAFRLGENLAVTPGKVVFENEMMQLIQYAPSTETVFARPLLIVPPWINKYYILDLKPENSLIKWMVAQGHTVFVISWVNPEARHAQKTFDDYLTDGLIVALDKIRLATGVTDCNAAGYCLGGTLLAVALAWLAARGEASRIASATFLTAMVDFADAGDMKLFIDEAQLDQMNEEMQARGFLPADFLRQTFALMRSNDMIWTFVVNNYLLGREPFPFDMLYWNDDATNMPAAMHSFYLRKCYLENVLREPGGVTIAGVPIDMRIVATPSYLLSTREDHIAPWKATYAGTQLFKGPVTFTLAASGHVAGVVNPPDAQKYNFWTSTRTPAAPDDWLAQADVQDGSWWPHWEQWLRGFGGERIPACAPGGGKLAVIEDAPGRYVTMKSES